MANQPKPPVKIATANDGVLIKGTGKDPCDKSKMTKEERFIYDHREAIKKAARGKITPELVGAIILDEQQRMGYEDKMEDFFLRWSLGQDYSLGPAQMKPSVVYELVDQGFINKPTGWNENKPEITGRWLLEPKKSAELVAARLEQTVQHWANGGVDISDRPEILGTLYSLGLTGKKGVNSAPQFTERGKNIADNLMKRVKEILACPAEVSPKKTPEGSPQCY